MDKDDDKQLRRELGKRLRDARQAAVAGHRYTQGEVAAALGKGVAAISAWETGRTLPDALAVRWMGQHYGVSADVLLVLKPAQESVVPTSAETTAPAPAMKTAAAPPPQAGPVRVNTGSPSGETIELSVQDFIGVLDRALGSGLTSELEKHAFIEGVLAAYRVKRPVSA